MSFWLWLWLALGLLPDDLVKPRHDKTQDRIRDSQSSRTGLVFDSPRVDDVAAQLVASTVVKFARGCRVRFGSQASQPSVKLGAPHRHANPPLAQCAT